MNVTLHDAQMRLVGSATLPDSAVPPELVQIGTDIFVHVAGFTYRRTPLTEGQIVSMPGNVPTGTSEDPAQL